MLSEELYPTNAAFQSQLRTLSSPLLLIAGRLERRLIRQVVFFCGLTMEVVIIWFTLRHSATDRFDGASRARIRLFG